MLEDTLVLFTTEFGRTPFAQSAADVVGLGRDHNQYGFSVWLAGAGLKHGIAYGSTDEIGWKAGEGVVTWPDFHATVLAPAGHRPQAIDILSQWNSAPADERPWRSCQADPGVMRPTDAVQSTVPGGEGCVNFGVAGKTEVDAVELEGGRGRRPPGGSSDQVVVDDARGRHPSRGRARWRARSPRTIRRPGWYRAAGAGGETPGRVSCCASPLVVVYRTELPVGPVGHDQNRNLPGDFFAVVERFPLLAIAAQDVDRLGEARKRTVAVEHVAHRRSEEAERRARRAEHSRRQAVGQARPRRAGRTVARRWRRMHRAARAA